MKMGELKYSYVERKHHWYKRRNEIKQLLNLGWTGVRIAQLFHMSTGMIYAINRRMIRDTERKLLEKNGFKCTDCGTLFKGFMPYNRHRRQGCNLDNSDIKEPPCLNTS